MMACCEDLDDNELEDFNEYQCCEIVVPDVCL